MADDDDLWFERNGSVGKALLAWHRNLGGDTGGRAELRRLADPSEAVFVPAFHRLRASLEEAAPGVQLRKFDRLERVATIACVTANVKEDLVSGSLGSQLAKVQGGSSKPAVSTARFRRLLGAAGPPELAQQLRRIVALLDGRADVVALAKAIYRWTPRTRQTLALDYYRIAPAQNEEAARTKTTKGART